MYVSILDIDIPEYFEAWVQPLHRNFSIQSFLMCNTGRLYTVILTLKEKKIFSSLGKSVIL